MDCTSRYFTLAIFLPPPLQNKQNDYGDDLDQAWNCIQNYEALAKVRAPGVAGQIISIDNKETHKCANFGCS